MSTAALVARLLAQDPAGLKGAVLRGPPGPARVQFLDELRATLPAGAPVRRMPAGIADDRLLGGLDLAATLAAGRPVEVPGLLAEVEGGILIVPSVERLPPETAARLAQALDGASRPFLLLLLDEGVEGEGAPPALAARLAFDLDPEQLPDPPSGDAAPVVAPEATLVGIASELGIAGVRAPMQAVKAARAAAALAGRTDPAEADLLLATLLVLAPRATRLPEAKADAAPPEPAPPEAGDSRPDADPQSADHLTDLAVEAVRAVLPPGLLAAQAARARASAGRSAGAGRRSANPRRGRRAGVRSGAPGPGVRLDLVETLKAAAPWQPVRRRAEPGRAGLLVRRSDFRIRRLVSERPSATLFVVDASGSAALARLNEAKGAIELLLADSYVRRDEVALIAFRGERAELVLPPTRSLARARRVLGDMAGGGGTPLAAAIDLAGALAARVLAAGRDPTIV
ncbi:MAG: VWA domain-containing protein, partial [Sphingomonadaceae bacterium]